MSVQTTFDVPASSANARFSTRVAFFIAGVTMASWAPMVPLIKARAAIDDGTLGLLLLGLGTGSMIAMPVAGYLTTRVGCRAVITAAVLGLCAALLLLATLSSLPLIALGVLLFGATAGLLDCAMNIQALIVERASRKPRMSGFHGLFSLGGIVGALGMTALLGAGLSALSAQLCVVGTTLLALMIAGTHLLPYGNERDGPLFAMPHGIVAFLGCLCFIVFLTEGAMLDWSGVFLVSWRGVEPAYAGVGYAAFAVAMTVGRLTGDAIVARLGGPRVTLLGGLCAAAGMTLSIAVPFWQAALLGYVLVGLGCSNLVPVFFSAVSRQTAMPQATAVPAMSTMGFAGILAGPAAIGGIAHLSNLEIALCLLVVMLLFVAASGRRLG